MDIEAERLLRKERVAVQVACAQNERAGPLGKSAGSGTRETAWLEDTGVSAILTVRIGAALASYLPERVAKRTANCIAGSSGGKAQRVKGLEVEPQPEKAELHVPKYTRGPTSGRPWGFGYNDEAFDSYHLSASGKKGVARV